MNVSFSKFNLVVWVLVFLKTMAQPNSAFSNDLWENVSDLTYRCVVQPFVVDSSGSVRYLELQNLCDDIQKLSENTFSIRVKGTIYFAVLTESPFSDGGDLNDLSLFLENGQCVAELKNVAAFGNIFIALMRGRDQFRQIQNQENSIQSRSD